MTAHTYFEKEERSQINKLNFHLKELEKADQMEGY